jgi:hypothetical protein
VEIGAGHRRTATAKRPVASAASDDVGDLVPAGIGVWKPAADGAFIERRRPS